MSGESKLETLGNNAGVNGRTGGAKGSADPIPARGGFPGQNGGIQDWEGKGWETGTLDATPRKKNEEKQHIQNAFC